MAQFSQEKTLNPFNTCKFLTSILRVTFSKCSSLQEDHPVSTPEAEEPAIDFDVDDEQVFVSSIISKYMESKSKKRALSPEAVALMINPKAMQVRVNCGESKEDCLSKGNRLPRCSSATGFDAFVSVKTGFTRSLSWNKIDFQDSSKRTVVVEFFRCEGWPIGLRRKAALLIPPLPTSPPDSWSWRKTGGGGVARIHGGTY